MVQSGMYDDLVTTVDGATQKQIGRAFLCSTVYRRHKVVIHAALYHNRIFQTFPAADGIYMPPSVNLLYTPDVSQILS